jgi:DNA-binding CsgD family transcriptional regulator
MAAGSETIARLGATVEAIGAPAFPARLAGALRSIVPYSFTVVFGYLGAARPFDLYDDFPEARRQVFVTDYQEGPYLLDPFYLAATRPVAPGLYRMRDLAPDRFYQGEYFRSYYVRTGLAEEIGFFVDGGGGSTIVISLMRDDRVFTRREFAELSRWSPLVAAAAGRHWSDLAERFERRTQDVSGQAAGQLELSLRGFGEGLLTPRERQVVEYTLRGHSAEAAGRALGISPGTVRIHRRNIYAKLGIGSQGELFSRFISTLSRR